MGNPIGLKNKNSDIVSAIKMEEGAGCLSVESTQEGVDLRREIC